MSQPGGGSLGALFVDVRPGTSRFEPELSKGVTDAGNKAADAAGPGMGRRLAGAMGKALAVGTGVLAVALTKGLSGAVKQASDLNETVSRSNVVFGKNAGAIQAWAQGAATSMGQSTKAAIDGATTFALYGKAAGKSGKDLVGFSTGLSGLASDMASFSNTSPEQAIEAIGAAMRGESDPIEAYGVLLNETVLKNRALKMGIIETTKQALTPQQRVLAVQAELFAQLGNKGSKTLGDFQRTQAGLANQTRISRAMLTNFSATIGQSLLPIVTQMVTTFNSKVIPALQVLWAQHGPQVVAFLSTAATRFGTWAASIDKADVSGWLNKARGAFASAAPVIQQFFANFKEGGSNSIGDTVRVTGVAMGFLADHADILAKALPYVAAALVVVKVAQLAANVATAVAPFATLAAASANRKLAASNLELAAAQRVTNASTVTGTVAQGASSAATNVGTLARARQAITTGALTVATKAWTLATVIGTGVLKAFRIVMATAFGPISLIIAVVAALAAGIVWLYKNNDTARRIIDAAWKYIKIAVKAVGDWFMAVLWPGMKRVFDGIVFAVKFMLKVWKLEWELAKAILSTVWGAIKGTFNAVKNFIMVTLPNAFKTGVGFIKAYWNALKEAAAIPVRFVINTVFNGIGNVFNKVAGFLHLPDNIRMPKLAAGFASGGRLPGRPSDVDNMLATGPGGRPIALAGGEYVVNARQTQKHLPILRAINEGTEGFADGGLVGFLKNPVSWIKDRVAGPLGRIKALAGNGGFGQALLGMGTRVRDGAIERAKSFIGGLFGGGSGPGNGTGILKGLTAQMVVAARQVMAATGMRVVSGLRPGAITVTGNRSYHGFGRAADFAPPSMRAFNIMRGLFGYARELIYSPAGGRQVHNGSPHMYTGAVRATHWDHIHLALARGGKVRRFDQGGIWPTGTVGVNTSGRSETVTSGQTMDDAVAVLHAILDALQRLAPDLASAFAGNVARSVSLSRQFGSPVKARTA